MKAFRRTASLLLALLLCFPMLATMLVSGLSTADVSYYDGTYSTDWYYSNTSAKEFHLKSAADLAGYVYLVNTVFGGASFGGCTVKLDCNVVWNEGSASDWIDSAPEYSWTPISISEKHYSSGGFDGQGHYISGLYQKDDGANHTGFIGVHGGSDWGVKNLAIVNSLFCKTSSGGSQNGNYGVGVFMSTPYNSFTFSNLYTDAIVMDSSDHTGGIVGNPRSNNAVCTLNNCVFAGTIISGGSEVGGMVGTNNTRKVRINNCLNLGSIYGKNAVGGMIGSTDSSEASAGELTVTGCINAGPVKALGTGTYGAILGNNGATHFSSNVNGCVAVDVAVTALNGGAAVSGSGNKTVSAASIFDQPALDLASLGSGFATGWVNHEGGYPMPTSVSAMVKELEIALPTDENGRFVDRAGIDVASYDPNQSEFLISNAAELKRFSFLNHYLGETFGGKTVKLTADIVLNEGDAADWAKNPPKYAWSPITDFLGTFDGQGHSISGLYYKGSAEAALFYRISNATLRNVMVLNSYIESTSSTAGVVYYAAGTSRVENVYCDAILRSKGHHNGGIVGLAGGPYLEIDSCVYAGSLYADMRYAGGILGNTNFKQIKVTNCLNLGSIAAADELGGIVGIGGNTTGDVVANCINAGYVGSHSSSYNGNIASWYLHNENDLANGGVYGTVKGSAPTAESIYKVTLDDCWLVTDFTPNRLSMLYQHSLTGKESLITLSELWGIDPAELDVDSYYPEYSFAEDWTRTESYPLPKTVEAMLRNAGVSLKLDADGKTVQALDMTWNCGLGDVRLKSSSQMALFSALSAEQSLTWADKNVYLLNDVTMSKEAFVADWTPLAGFAGTFDGRGNEIKGLQIQTDTETAAMFASVNGGTVKQLFLTDAQISSNRNASGLVWETTGEALIDNVYFEGSVASGYPSVGGILGVANAATEIRRCVVDGSIAGSSQVGGILGYYGGSNVTLSDCLVSAEVRGTADGVGGLIGLANNASVSHVAVKRCVVTGEVGSTPARKQGALIGSLVQSLDGNVFTDCYALVGSNAALTYNDVAVGGASFAQQNELTGFHLPLNGWEIVSDSYPLPSVMIADKLTNTLITLDAKDQENVVGWLAGGYFLPDGFCFRYRTTPPQGLTPASFQTVRLGLVTEDASVRMEEPYGIGFFTRIDKATYDALAELEAVLKVGTLITPTDYLENGVAFDMDALSFAHGQNAYLDVENDDGWYNAATAESDGFYRYRGSIVNIKAANADRPFSGAGYVKLRYSNGFEALYYGTETPKFHNGTIDELASEAVKQGGLSVEEQAICEGLQKEDSAISVRFLGQLRDHFKVNGRTSALSEGITVDWSGSSIEFNLNCSGDVKISAIGSYATALGSGNTNFTVYVDGVATKTVAVNNGYNKDILIASGLAAGEHHFRLSKWAHAESAQVEFTKLSFQGELLARPADSEIFIEIVGDSISCGYGNNNGANDGNLSYGYIAADLLDADYSIFARSGLWLVNKGAAAIPDLYPYVSWYRDGGVPGGELYDFANARVPDVVVINLGTNDYNGNAGADAFAAAMKSFVAQIRQGYGNDVPIVWAYGMMNDGYKDTIVSVVEELGGAQSNNYALGFEQNNTGVNSHPDTAHQQKNGEELADYIRELLK